MLQEAKDIQKRAVFEIYEQLNRKKEITFKAPTGSGKTYMMADLINCIMERNEKIVILVSSLSKGNLAAQNYDKFCEYMQSGAFPLLKPYLISTEISGEEQLFIPDDYNVYFLPRDLYKQGGRLMQGVMDNFLTNITLYEGKTVFLIKDECHIATSNLDTLSTKYFTKVLNFSATPKLSRGQHPDVEIKEDEAVAAKLIKKICLGDETDSVEAAINRFEEIKADYRNLLGVNPCLIIQISNKDKADEELNNTIFPILNKAEHQDLKWMLIVDKDTDCDTNDVFKAKKLPVSKWKNYAKDNTSGIDIIIFKMVISEGWDIPRACMLYQIRDSKSKQLDEQVMGRVRRNPRLLDFETLSANAQELAMTAWVWGILPEVSNQVYGVKLWDEPSDITDAIRISTTKLKPLTKKEGFDLAAFIENRPPVVASSSIFDLYRKLDKSGNDIQKMCYEYCDDDISKWWSFTENIGAVEEESNKYVCDYAKSMELTKDENGDPVTTSFAVSSSYVDKGHYVLISDWVWKRRDGDEAFSFDSDAEFKWASKLKDLVSSFVGNQRVGKQVTVGKSNPNITQGNSMFEDYPHKINPQQKYLWGKNYIPNSMIRFEYCLGGVHASYPDFIMQDCFNRIHLFEVKSMNGSNASASFFDAIDYEKKIVELRRCYLQASKLTGHIFYLPVLKDTEWRITRLMNGEEKTLTFSQFETFIKSPPES